VIAYPYHVSPFSERTIVKILVVQTIRIVIYSMVKYLSMYICFLCCTNSTVTSIETDRYSRKLVAIQVMNMAYTKVSSTPSISNMALNSIIYI